MWSLVLELFSLDDGPIAVNDATQSVFMARTRGNGAPHAAIFSGPPSPAPRASCERLPCAVGYQTTIVPGRGKIALIDSVGVQACGVKLTAGAGANRKTLNETKELTNLRHIANASGHREGKGIDTIAARRNEGGSWE
jgi:hypothetical protein